MLKAFAYPDVTGITFVLLWRFRELIWIGIELPALAVAGRGSVFLEKTPQANSLRSRFIFIVWRNR